jgi:predicted lipid-binding transport protein (Tim44 family)
MRGLHRILIGLLTLFSLMLLAGTDLAWARAGGGGSMGSRGSRSYSSPSRSYSAPTPSAPSASPYARPTTPGPAPYQPSPFGGFLRSMGGGILGGLLGGMLFRSLGFAGGFGGFGGGGFGLFDLLLLGGIAFLIYSMVKRRRAQAVPAEGAYGRTMVEAPASAEFASEPPRASSEEDVARGLSHIRQMDAGFDEGAFRELVSDRFFQIQAAWMRRDLDKLRPLLSEEMVQAFRGQIEEARAKRRINKLENISVRSVDITEAWQEQGNDFVTVRFLANLLDYTVDESTGTVVDGSDSVPVKFEEYWTWVRPVGPNPWRLAAINQA